MSLETKIDNLIVAIEKMTATLEKLYEPATSEQKSDPATTSSAQAIIVSAEELQSLCTKIVRADRNKKNAILAVLAEYNGAKLIADIDVAYYPAINAKLEALLNV